MHRHRYFVLSAAAAAVLTLITCKADAVTDSHWTGSVSTDWSNGANWGGPGSFAPTQDLTSSIAYFDTATTLDPNIAANTTVAGTQFLTSHTISGAAGKTLTLGTAVSSAITFSVLASAPTPSGLSPTATFNVPVIAGGSNDLDVVADESSTINFNGALSGSHALNISNALSDGNSHVNINAVASFSGALNVNGGVNVSLAANQQIAGNYNINSGGISIDSASALGTSNINLGTSSGGAGSLTVSSSNDIAVANNVNVQSNYSFGVLTGGGTITNSGTGNLTLSGPIQIGTSSNIAQLTVGGTGNSTISGDITAFYNSNYDAGSSILKTGTGTLTITGNNASTWGNNEGNYTGDLNVNQGMVQLRNGQAIGTKSTINVESGGTLDLGGTSQTIGSLNNYSNDPGGSVTLGSATLTLNGGISGANFSGVISGTGGIVVTGDANQTLSGTNTYIGGTTITNGTLLAGSNVPLTGSGAFGNSSSPIVVGNSNTTTGAFVGIGGDGPYDGTNFHPITIAKNIQFSAGAALTRGIDANTDNGIISGDLQLAGSDILISTNAPEDLSNTSALTISGHITGTGGLVIQGGSGGLILTGNAAGENATRNITIVSANLLIKDNTAAGTTPILLGTSANGGLQAGLYTIAPVTVARAVTVGSDAAVIGGYGDFNSTFSGNISMGNFGLQLYSETTTPGNAVTLSGAISGASAVFMTGTGTAVLSGTNTYTQGTIIEGGTLRVSADANLGAVPGSVKAANIELVNDGYTNVVTLGIDSTFAMSSNRGITVVSDSSTTTVGAIDVASGATLTYGGIIAGNNASNSKLLKTGAGTLSLSGASTIGGGFTLQGGTVLVGAAVPTNGTGTANNSPLGRQGVALGNSSSTSSDAPTLLMNGAFNFSRTLTITSGIAATPTFGNNTDDNVTYSGTVALGKTTNIQSAATSSGKVLTLSNTVSGTGGIVKTGAGALTLTSTGNTYSGGTTVQAGTIFVANNIPAAGTSTSANSVLGRQGITIGNSATGTSDTPALLTNQTSGTVTFSRAITVAASNGTLGGTTNNNTTFASGITLNKTLNVTSAATGSNTVAFNGALGGAGGITKVGAGNVTFAAANTYNGDTAVNFGTLALTGAASIANSSNISVASGATLDVHALTNRFSLGQSQTLSGSGTVKGNMNVSGTVNGNTTINGDVALTGTGVIKGYTDITGALSGSGSVGPGNSPGLVTAGQLNPSSGMSFNFEMTKDGAPDFSDVSNIGNDVLRLTDPSTPLTASFTASNIINFYIENSALNGNSSVTMDGGLFTDSAAANVLSSVLSATIKYYIQTPGGSTTYNGNTYSLLSPSAFSPHLSIIPESANFAGGTVNGQITELSLTSNAVPLPASALAGSALLAGLYIRNVRNRRRFANRA